MDAKKPSVSGKRWQVPGVEGRNGNLRQPFSPTLEQRNFVAAMAGFKFTHQELANLIINPHTQKPISVDTLDRHFGHELRTGKERLKSAIGTQYIKRLNAGEWNAIHWGLKHIFNYREEEVKLGVGVQAGDDNIRIEFVLPDSKEV